MAKEEERRLRRAERKRLQEENDAREKAAKNGESFVETEHNHDAIDDYYDSLL